jgi:hypothetical protein
MKEITISGKTYNNPVFVFAMEKEQEMNLKIYNWYLPE